MKSRKCVFLITTMLFLTTLGQSQNFTLVVLGSSTAGGSGASTSDSAWVARFRKSIALLDPLSSVINLSWGGQTTYNVLPDEFQKNGYPTINIDRNITKAFSFKPDAIIVNLPSNDAQAGYTVKEQLRNYFILDSVAKQQNVPIWFVSTQPRNLSNSINRNSQLELKDSLLSIYKDFAIDVFTELSDSNNFILKKYDAGDGIHLSDKGHKVIYEQVKNSSLYNYVYKFYVVRVNPKIEGEIQCYPNPFIDELSFDIPSDLLFPVEFSVLNIETLKNELEEVFENEFDLINSAPLKGLSKGAYFIKLSSQDREFYTKVVKLD